MKQIIRLSLFLTVSCLMCMPALAESLRGLIEQNPHAQLEKAIQIIKKTTTTDLYTKSSNWRGIDIDSCAYIGDWRSDTPNDHFIAHFYYIARFTAHMQRLLAAAGYPNDVWQDGLQKLTTAQVNEALRRLHEGLDLKDTNGMRQAVLPYEHRLADAMNAYRAKAGRPLAKANVWAQCGQVRMGTVNIRTIPKNARVQLIPELDALHCRSNNLNPYSLDECNTWFVPASEVTAGRYWYKLEKRGNPAECGEKIFFNMEPDPVEETIVASGIACSG